MTYHSVEILNEAYFFIFFYSFLLLLKTAYSIEKCRNGTCIQVSFIRTRDSVIRLSATATKYYVFGQAIKARKVNEQMNWANY